jgi:hypothetical protein
MASSDTAQPRDQASGNPCAAQLPSAAVSKQGAAAVLDWQQQPQITVHFFQNPEMPYHTAWNRMRNLCGSSWGFLASLKDSYTNPGTCVWDSDRRTLLKLLLHGGGHAVALFVEALQKRKTKRRQHLKSPLQQSQLVIG